MILHLHDDNRLLLGLAQWILCSSDSVVLFIRSV